MLSHAFSNLALVLFNKWAKDLSASIGNIFYLLNCVVTLQLFNPSFIRIISDGNLGTLGSSQLSINITNLPNLFRVFY
jgi:hypothetical protein